MYARFELAIYCRVIQSEIEGANTYAMLIHELPRRFHLRSREEQAAFLRERPPLTRTRWDALLAAIVKHVARLHDHPVPEWVDEPERFLDTPWIVWENPVTAMDSVLYAPGAFIRHGALPDPLDLDARDRRRLDSWPTLAGS